MSEIKAEVVKISKIETHNNADSLEVAVVQGWYCVIKKNQFQAGNKCIYIPIDSCLPKNIEAKIFQNAKIQLKNGRVKTLRIRGAISQGLVVDPKLFNLDTKPEGYDATKDLGITKYEPPEPGFQSGLGKRGMPRKQNSSFKKYTDIENGKRHTEVFEPDEMVYVTEKIHGTNARMGWVKRDLKNPLKRLWARINKNYAWEFIVGSHNVQLRDTAKNLYCDIAKKYGLKERLPKGLVVYGEIVGPGIQKDYSYGLTEKELFVFDVRKDDAYLDFHKTLLHCAMLGLKAVPVLAICRWSEVRMENYLPADFIGGPSLLSPEQKVREGAVVRSHMEASCRIGRKILKFINPEYLLGDQTDFH